jgi:hypothetical protein
MSVPPRLFRCSGYRGGFLLILKQKLQKRCKNALKMSISSQIVWPSQKKAVNLHHENPPSLFTMLKSAGRFIFLWHDIQKHIRHQHNW